MDYFPFFLPSPIFPDRSNGLQVILPQWTNLSNSPAGREEAQWRKEDSRPSQLVPLWCSCYGNSTFPQLMRMLCRKRKAERKAKRVPSVSAHFPEHNTPCRRKFRTDESISSLPANQSVIKVKTTTVTFPSTEVRRSVPKDEPNIILTPPQADKTK